MTSQEVVPVAKADLQVAWAVLENLAVSLQQLGSAFGSVNGASNGVDREDAFREALAAFFTPELVGTINRARSRIGQYVTDEEAEALAESIPYWDYASLKKTTRASTP